jgi:hypothetical protein
VKKKPKIIRVEDFNPEIAEETHGTIPDAVVHRIHE